MTATSRVGLTVRIGNYRLTLKILDGGTVAINFLEQLAAEWYEYTGYFVRRNINVGPRTRGGFDGELDVVAFHPTKDKLIHVEPSMDADSWEVREKRFRRKFDLGRKHIPQLFSGMKLPEKIEQIALLEFASTKNHQLIGGGAIVPVGEFLREVFLQLSCKSIKSEAVPEQFTILRSLQLVSSHWTEVRETVDRIRHVAR